MSRSGQRCGRARWLAVGCAGVFLAACLAPPAHAQSVSQAAPPLETAALPLVEIIAVGDLEALSRAQSLLGGSALGHFRSQWQSAVRFDPQRLLHESGTGAAARCFIDFSSLPEVRLYFADQRAQRFLLRSTSLSNPPNEIDREVLSQIVELSLQALLLPHAAGLTREEARSLLAPASAPPPRSTPPSPLRKPARAAVWSVRASALYSVAAHSSQVPFVHGPGIGVALSRKARGIAAGLDLRASYELPERYRGSQVGLEFSTVAVQLGAELLWVLGLDDSRSPSLGPRVGAGYDWSDLSPLPGLESTTVQPTAGRWSRSLFVNAGLLALVPFSSRVGAFGELSMTFDPARVEYDLILPAGTQPVIERYRIRPGAVLGIQSSW